MKRVPTTHIHYSFSKVFLTLDALLADIRAPGEKEFPGVRVVNCADRLVISPLAIFE
jgi:hypothetical protein